MATGRALCTYCRCHLSVLWYDSPPSSFAYPLESLVSRFRLEGGYCAGVPGITRHHLGVELAGERGAVFSDPAFTQLLLTLFVDKILFSSRQSLLSLFRNRVCRKFVLPQKYLREIDTKICAPRLPYVARVWSNFLASSPSGQCHSMLFKNCSLDLTQSRCSWS